ncbi:MAG TPA: phosphotransferase [Thiolinea sp.]|nr:phosphotransferase [Thiolinea sp.]
MHIPDPLQAAREWLAALGLRHPRLSRLSGGHTSHVFLIEQAQSPRRSVLRLANHGLPPALCPLASRPQQVIDRHRDAAALGLAPVLLAADATLGIMWIAWGGQERQLDPVADMARLHPLLTRLHRSDLDWERLAPDPAGLQLLQQQLEQPFLSPAVRETLLEPLLAQGLARGYGDWPSVPVHGDLNPGNCLHDGRRWWLIDWDYADRRASLWDHAGLIVEQGWHPQQLTVPTRPAATDLAWFCACFALLSACWHIEQGSNLEGPRLALARALAGP